MLKEYYIDNLNAREAKEEIQKLSFYPMMFQAARVLKSTGILKEVYKKRRVGITSKQIVENLSLPYYGVNMLLETGLTIGVVYLKEDDVYTLTKMGYHLLFDEATEVNINFTHDVCYKAMFHLEESILEEKAAGLHEIGINDKTIYPHLSAMQEPMKKSWFDFDHYYSDRAFPEALKIVFKEDHKHMLDIGGNTGKWSIKCCEYNPTVNMTIVDLPKQWEKAKENIKQLGFEDRITGIVGDVLSKDLALPSDADAVWMSQFLDCFSEEQIGHILTNIYNNISDDAVVYIQDLFWDRQKDFAAAYSLHGTSLYFTAIANGNSKMYHSRDMINIIKAVGFEVIEDIDEVGEFHTILKCKKVSKG